MEQRDLGLFGPDSVTWRLHRDPATLVGGVRALIVQALEPRAMAGVAHHSAFWDDPGGRLGRTIEYVATVTYADTATAVAAGQSVQRVHTRVRGTDPVTGRPYDAADPELLLWVHNVLVDSVLAGYRRFGGLLSRADADRYLAEQVRAAELVAIPPAMVATTEPDLADYFDAMAPSLVASATARRVVKLLATMPGPPLARPVWAVVVGAAMSSLPRWAKDAYGLPSCPPVDVAVAPGVIAMLKVLQRVLPPPPMRTAAEQRWAAAA